MADYITPKDRGVASSVAKTGVETAKGAGIGAFEGVFKGGFGAALAVGGAVALIAAAAAAVVAVPWAMIIGVSAAPVIGMAALSAGGIGAVIGGVVGAPTGGVIGGVIGTVKGFFEGRETIGKERGAARIINVQNEQAAAQTVTAETLQNQITVQEAQRAQAHEVVMTAAAGNKINQAHYMGAITEPTMAVGQGA